MALTFPTDFKFIGVTTQPRRQFELDRITRHWKINGATEEQVLAATGLPAIGDEHPMFAKMFVTGLATAESGETACVLDVNYTGCINTAEGGDPVLPANRGNDGDQIQSSQSSRSNAGATPSSPLSVEYYAPSTEVSFWTYGAKGARGTAADPTDTIRISSISIGDINFLPGGVLDTLVAQFFSEMIVGTIKSQEIVAGKFWLNTEQKTKKLTPFLFSLAGGDFLVLVAPGSGYTLGDSLTVSGGGGSATLTVTQLGISDSITGFTVTSNSYTFNSPPVAASGGTGTGATFQNVHIS